jgi:hypothetical protein
LTPDNPKASSFAISVFAELSYYFVIVVLLKLAARTFPLMAQYAIGPVVYASIRRSLLAEDAIPCNATIVTAEDMSGGELALRLIFCAVLLAFSALFSGLTLGVMGLDTNQLEIVRESGSAKDQKFASVILPVRKQGNLLLCTLLFGNVGVNSLMSIVLADLTSGVVGFLVSTVLIVILGEVIPQAACSRYSLRLGAMFVPVVRVIMLILYPVSKPVSMVLDYWLGEEIGVFYSKKELHKLVMMHVQVRVPYSCATAYALACLTNFCCRQIG